MNLRSVTIFSVAGCGEGLPSAQSTATGSVAARPQSGSPQTPSMTGASAVVGTAATGRRTAATAGASSSTAAASATVKTARSPPTSVAYCLSDGLLTRNRTLPRSPTRAFSGTVNFTVYLSRSPTLKSASFQGTVCVAGMLPPSLLSEKCHAPPGRR